MALEAKPLAMQLTNEALTASQLQAFAQHKHKLLLTTHLLYLAFIRLKNSARRVLPLLSLDEGKG